MLTPLTAPLRALQIASSGSLPELQRPWVKATIMQHSQQTLGGWVPRKWCLVGERAKVP